MLTGATAYYREKYGAGSPQHVASLPSRSSRAHIDRAKVEPRICIGQCYGQGGGFAHQAADFFPTMNCG
jgi:hypothetical protein